MNSLRISWVGALVGGVAAFLITIAVVLVVLPYFADWYLYLDPIVATGVVGLLVSMLRGSAGIFVGRLVRRRYEVDTSMDFVPTAMVAAVVAWLLYAGLLFLLGDATMLTTARGWIELPRWIIELSLGALVVGTEEPERVDWRFGRLGREAR
ncbi:hypothetical protein [uncultured Ornithinimicrobium sp.]|uniref:hypothetical protein n=1 Tax=uncultured Ornithinimicrobium sp. TaxID=259307 RepID=UPI002598A2C8|nr:hypothetical protein [uncultured Ornithinimicrobium sp.]